jgi:hypothetical protein
MGGLLGWAEFNVGCIYRLRILVAFGDQNR